MSEAGDKVRETMRQMGELADIEDNKKEKEDEIKRLGEQKSLFTNTHVLSEHEEITKLADHLNINATEARKQLDNFPNEYLVQEHTIPDVVRKMRKPQIP